jgi:hypothetical protein
VGPVREASWATPGFGRTADGTVGRRIPAIGDRPRRDRDVGATSIATPIFPDISACKFIPEGQADRALIVHQKGNPYGQLPQLKYHVGGSTDYHYRAHLDPSESLALQGGGQVL